VTSQELVKMVAQIGKYKETMLLAGGGTRIQGIFKEQGAIPVPENIVYDFYQAATHWMEDLTKMIPNIEIIPKEEEDE